ncbi:MAG TPA: hypothetical protein VFX21_14780 [Acidimicrobiia bacterium]|nr:hypothetical protein [Acidimicrobiia bacterium]
MTPSRPRKGAKRPAARRRPATGRDFWGTDAIEEEPADTIRPIDEPAAMVLSLGPPPLRGHEVAAEQYFRVVYDQAVALAVALAAANGLLDTEGDDDTPAG